MTKDAKDANAAKTLIWPTLDIIFGIVAAPIKYPTKYPDIKKPTVRLKSSCTALTQAVILESHMPSLNIPYPKIMPKNF